MDALTALHTGMHRQGASQWVLDADIKGCCDPIDHTALLPRLPVCTTTMHRWLQAGVVALGQYTDTAAGTPQEGGVTPARTMALEGMERLFEGEDTQGNPQRPSWKTGQNPGIRLMRYADDLVVVAPARTVLAQHVLPTFARFLADRGRHLSAAKTPIVHSPEGFNFLGFEIRRLPRALLTQPQKTKRLGHSRAITTSLHQHRHSPAVQVIHDLHPQMRGWGTSYRHCAAKRAVSKLDHRVWHARWRWAKCRHPNQSAPWVRQRYCRPVGPRQGVLTEAKAQMLWYQNPDDQIPQGPREIVTAAPGPQGVLDTTGTMAPEAPDHQTTKNKPSPRPSLPVWAL